MKATIYETHDTGETKSFQDENERVWEVWLDDNGSGLVESHEGVVPLAGEFTWWEEGVEIQERPEGATFGVSCQDEFIVRDGRWIENKA